MVELTEFRRIENPFVEKNDTGAESDPDTAVASANDVATMRAKKCSIHDIDCWVNGRPGRLGFLDSGVDGGQHRRVVGSRELPRCADLLFSAHGCEDY